MDSLAWLDLMEVLFPNHDGSKFIILDGGSGTTLADEFGCQLASHLWSAELLVDRPEVLASLHRAWEQAGAQIISTASYQATLEGFSSLLSQSGPAVNRNSLNGLQLLRTSVTLARHSLTREDSRVALSLGPFGATLIPGQEYTGSYPAPYDTFEKLVEFHYDRLMNFAEDEVTWDNVDVVLFETVPNLIEARAIRQAWKKLDSHLNRFPRVDSAPSKNPTRTVKPWVISFVFSGLNGGEFPTGEAPTEVLEAALEFDSELAEPSGIGVNCTKLEHLTPILKAWTSTDRVKPSTWLWLYPDGGPTYDPINRAWSGSTLTHEQWAQSLLKVANEFSKYWAGVVLGGCCKAGTQHIHALHQLSLPISNPAKTS